MELTMNKQIFGPIKLPLKISTANIATCRLYLYKGKEYYHILEFGKVTRQKDVMVRIESACTYAHLYGSMLCDCNIQLKKAIMRLSKSKKGLLIYALDQHGRGIGIVNHIKVYEQEQNLNYDTTEAHISLGLKIDNREYNDVLNILRYFKIQGINLLTNNPKRVDFFKKSGIKTEITPLQGQLDKYNCRELMIKKEKLNHDFSFTSDKEWIDILKEQATDSKMCYALLIENFKTKRDTIIGNKLIFEKKLKGIIENYRNAKNIGSIYIICPLDKIINLTFATKVSYNIRLIISKTDVRQIKLSNANILEYKFI